MSDNSNNNNTLNQKAEKKAREPFGYIINDRGEEIPITEEMVAQSMADIKLQSIGTHTGYNKAISDDMLPNSATRHIKQPTES